MVRNLTKYPVCMVVEQSAFCYKPFVMNDTTTPTPAVAALKEAITVMRSQKNLAAVVNKAQGHVSHWLLVGLPHPYGPAIERATGIPVERLCPGTIWCRVADADWPHPEGRPLVDFSGQGQPAALEAAHA